MEASAVVLMARRTQVKDLSRVHPVSLINIWSPMSLLPTGPESHLRSLAVAVAGELPEACPSMGVLKLIFEKLKPFKIQSLKIDHKWKRLIVAELAKLELTEEMGGDFNMKWLVSYHSMLWKTGHGWTYRRTPEEMNVERGYHPTALGVFDDITCVETRLGRERLESLDLRLGQVDEDLAAVAGNYDDWKKIGVFEFCASALMASNPLEGPTSQETVVVSIGDGNRWGCVPATQATIDRGEKSWTNTLSEEQFTLTNSMKKLYDIRPHAIERMVFAQFLAQYRLLKPSGRETKDAERQLGQSEVGPLSDTTIAGTTEGAPTEGAPTLLKLSNSRIVKKRKQEEGNLLPMVKCMDQTLDDRAKRYLFKPWRQPETMMQDEEFDAAIMEACDEVRLELYPTSYFH